MTLAHICPVCKGPCKAEGGHPRCLKKAASYQASGRNGHAMESKLVKNLPGREERIAALAALVEAGLPLFDGPRPYFVAVRRDRECAASGAYHERGLVGDEPGYQ